MNLLDLMVKVSVDDQASSRIAKTSDSIKNGLTSAAKVGVAAVEAIGAAVAGTTVALIGAANAVAGYGDNIDKMSQKMGMSSDTYQEWDAVMRHSGTSIDSMKASMKTLASAAESGNEAFQRLGITQEQIASMSQEELFEATITGLQNVEDTTERTYLAGQLLGRGATELGALLNMSAEETQAMRDRVHELGGVMSQDAVKASARFKDSLQDMRTAITGVRNSLVSELLPGMSTIMVGLADIFSGGIDKGKENVEKGVAELTAKIVEVIPKAMSALGGIVGAIGSVIVSAIPSVAKALFSGGVEMVGTLVQGFVSRQADLISAISKMFSDAMAWLAENKGAINESMGNLVSGVVEALQTALPIVIEALGNIWSTLLGMILEYGPMVVENVVLLIQGVAQTLIDNLPFMIQTLSDMLAEYLNTLGEWIPFVIDQVVTMITDIVSSFAANAPEILKAAQKFFENVLTGLKDNLPKIIDGLVQGLLDLIDMVIEHGPELLAAAGEFIMNVAWAIVENLPEILAALWDGLTKLIGGVIERAPDMLAAAGEFVMKLFEALVNHQGDVVKAAADLGWGIIESIGNFFNDMWNAGVDLVQGLIDGISNSIGGVLDTILGGLQDAVDAALDFLGIASPSKLFSWMGDMTMEGMAEGIEDTAEEAERAMRKAADGIYGAASGSVDVSGAFDVNGSHGVAQAVKAVTINIDTLAVREEADIDRIAELLSQKVNREMGGTLWNLSSSAA